MATLMKTMTRVAHDGGLLASHTDTRLRMAFCGGPHSHRLVMIGPAWFSASGTLHAETAAAGLALEAGRGAASRAGSWRGNTTRLDTTTPVHAAVARDAADLNIPRTTREVRLAILHVGLGRGIGRDGIRGARTASDHGEVRLGKCSTQPLEPGLQSVIPMFARGFRARSGWRRAQGMSLTVSMAAGISNNLVDTLVTSGRDAVPIYARVNHGKGGTSYRRHNVSRRGW